MSLTRSRGTTRLARLSALLAVALGASLATASASGAASESTAAGDAGQLRIASVSNPRAQLVSGGDVLVRVRPPRGASPSDVTVLAGGRSVTDRFVAQPDGSLLGLVTGLGEGRTRLTARSTEPEQTTTLDVTNHPITGPVFSGPQQQPFYCQTTVFGLAPAVQPDCTAPTKVTYQYRTTAGQFAPLADPSDRPADLASARVNGRDVPYIVRVERGTIDRAVYELAALYDGSGPSPTRPDRAWNERLVYTFGGGCNAGYHQGASTGGVVNDLFLSQGYAVASSTLNVLDNNCSAVISAEAAMMVKEHVIETYGPVRHTIGWGGSGGAIQQYTIADSYPGILDGIIPGISFPDPISVIGVVSDCRLLGRYFASDAGLAASFTPEQKTAVSGFRSFSSCGSWDATFASRATATDSCDPAIPLAARYDPVTNPGGVKCSFLEQLVNQLGRDPETGFVRSPLDNRGVQYGRAALEAGTISPAQFVDLNARMGGLDYRGVPVAARTAADPKALAAVYRNDLLNSASQGLRTTPIIDQRTDLDLLSAGFADIHTTEWSYVMRARLQKANGTSANQVIIETSYDPATAAAAASYELTAMDRWLTNLGRDTSDRPQLEKVLAAKPTGLGDGCYLSATQRIREALTYPAQGRCGAAFPVAGNPRLAAGADLDLTTVACRREAFDPRDYPVTFTPRQQQRLREVFATGVCDYGRLGINEQAPTHPWIRY